MKNNLIKEQDFPILTQSIHGKRLAYLDNAATTQKPRAVLDAIIDYYSLYNANIHRGVHLLSTKATKAYEDTRLKVKQFINAKSEKECVFVRSSTEAINLVASTFGEANVQAGDTVLITEMEHHSNIVPWQMLCQRKGATLSVIPMTQSGELNLHNLENLLTSNTKLMAISYVSNALGTIHPIKDMIKKAHQKNIPVLVDAAQAAAHLPIDVIDLDCDFLTFSSHKMYGPTGAGVLYGKSQWLEKMPPYQGGGDMVVSVEFTHSDFQDFPQKFEAGTQAIASVIGLGKAIDYIQDYGFSKIIQEEQELLSLMQEKLSSIPGLQMIGALYDNRTKAMQSNQTNQSKIGIVSFVMEGIHPHDIGTIVDGFGVAIRTGHHCAMPIMQCLGLPATARASLGLYNTKDDVMQLIDALNEVKQLFKKGTSS